MIFAYFCIVLHICGFRDKACLKTRDVSCISKSQTVPHFCALIRYKQSKQSAPATNYSTLVARSYVKASAGKDLIRFWHLSLWIMNLSVGHGFLQTAACFFSCCAAQDPELIARQALDGTNRYRASKVRCRKQDVWFGVVTESKSLFN